MGISRSYYETGWYEHAINFGLAAVAMNRYFPGVHKVIAFSQEESGNLDAAVTTMNCAVLYETSWNDDNKRDVRKLYDELHEELSSLQAGGK
mmetsp:Transcript_62484/g.92876  ORF Transcript_62484/g.92876 Transcript_62484/m.92876 type:complete len:92 (-) Transcript_62484:2321-2596(-)